MVSSKTQILKLTSNSKVCDLIILRRGKAREQKASIGCLKSPNGKTGK